MLRSLGFNIPEGNDIAEFMRGKFDYIADEAVEFYPMSDREVLEAHGYDLTTPVDAFMRNTGTLRPAYAQAMRGEL